MLSVLVVYIKSQNEPDTMQNNNSPKNENVITQLHHLTVARINSQIYQVTFIFKLFG